METFSALLAICAGIHRSQVNSPHKGQWRGALMFSLIWVWKNGWVNNCKAGDLRRHRAYYDVSVMQIEIALSNIQLGPMVVGVQKLMFHTLNVLRLIIQKKS